MVAEDNPNFTFADGILFDKEKKTLLAYLKGKETKTYSIPNSVTCIDDGAFYNCTSLVSINIPDSVRRIGHLAFWGCTSLTKIEVPNSLEYIGDNAFDIGDSLIRGMFGY